MFYYQRTSKHSSLCANPGVGQGPKGFSISEASCCSLRVEGTSSTLTPMSIFSVILVLCVNLCVFVWISVCIFAMLRIQPRGSSRLSKLKVSSSIYTTVIPLAVWGGCENGMRLYSVLCLINSYHQIRTNHSLGEREASISGEYVKYFYTDRDKPSVAAKQPWCIRSPYFQSLFRTCKLFLPVLPVTHEDVLAINEKKNINDFMTGFHVSQTGLELAV